MKLPLANSSPWIKWSSAIAALTFAVLLVNSWDRLRSWAPVTRGGMEAYAGELVADQLKALAPRLIDLEIQNYAIIRSDLEGRLFTLELRADRDAPDIREAIEDLKKRIAMLDRQTSAAECERAILARRPFLGCGM